MSDAEVKKELKELTKAVSKLTTKVEVHIAKGESLKEKVDDHEQRITKLEKTNETIKTNVATNSTKANMHEWIIRIGLVASSSLLTTLIVRGM